MITSKEEAIRKIEKAQHLAFLAELERLTNVIENKLKTTTTFDISTYNYSKPVLDRVIKELIQQGYDIQVLPNYIKVS